MKKLAILVSLVVATPVFACPMHDAEQKEKTAEKDKAPAKDETAKKEEAPAKKDEAKPAETAKAKEQPKQDTTKKPTKVSQK